MIISICLNYKISIPDCNIETIIACFKKVSILFLRDFTTIILKEFAVQYMGAKELPFGCRKCGKKNFFTWKTKHAKDTKIGTILGEIILGQMQVICTNCGKKMFITENF